MNTLTEKVLNHTEEITALLHDKSFLEFTGIGCAITCCDDKSYVKEFINKSKLKIALGLEAVNHQFIKHVEIVNEITNTIVNTMDPCTVPEDIYKKYMDQFALFQGVIDLYFSDEVKDTIQSAWE